MKFMTKIVLMMLLLSVLPLVGCTKEHSLEERREGVLSDLSLAIQEAKEAGVYKCCINPDCTMCYLGANKWNYGKAGECHCDDFIAKGEDPCPQCVRGIEEGRCSSVEEFCDLSDDFKEFIEEE
jgi:hypothetical protein